MAAADFSQCLAFTLRYEGGKADDRRDPGGRTNQGVTQKTFTAWLVKKGQPSRDVYTMTAEERDAIYRGSYWLAVKADTLGAGVDLALFDFGVNSGPARAVKAYAKRVSSDGATVVKAVCAERLSFLHALGTFKTFGKGWTTRVAACEALGVKMAEHARIGLDPAAPVAPQVSSTLQHAASAAEAKGAARSKAAAGAATVGGAGTATMQAGFPHLPWPLIAIAVLVVVAGAGILAWRASVARARANAYHSVAAGA